MSAALTSQAPAPGVLVFTCEGGSLADPPEVPALPGVVFLRVPCVCRVSEGDLLRGLRRGARAVLLLGCREGACRFHGGDARADEAVARVRQVLERAGLPGAAVALLRAGASAEALPEVARTLAQSLPPGFSGLTPLAWANRALPPGAPFPHHGAVQEAFLVASMAAAQAGLAVAPSPAGAPSGGEDLLYACDLPAVETLLGEPFGLHGASMREAALALAVAAGLRPRVAPALPGCGHDFRFLGDHRTLGALAPLGRDALRREGVSRVVPLCPECGVTLRERYPLVGADLGLPVVDLIDLLYERRDRLRFEVAPPGPRVALFVDVDDRVVGRQQRSADLLERAGYEVVVRLPEPDAEPGTQGSAGVEGFVACDAAAREAQGRLLATAQQAGATWLLCSSPFSAVHLRCAVRRGAWRRDRLEVQSLYEALSARLVPQVAATGPRPE